ncbi:MAG: WecB/TagA/CpsF family glycosyltransferase [Anaerolineae bacterium]|nr:WecB/TagA/CpsF family glycosyltransferase [Anaerolineae bacterium]
MTEPVRSSVILGVRVHALAMQHALAAICGWIADHQSRYICCTPAHAIMACYDEPELRSVYNRSGLSTPDGMAIVWLLRLRGFSETRRVYGPDLLEAACRFGLDEGWRHYFWGGAPGVAGRVAQVLTARFPGLQVVGVESPPFRPLTQQELQAVRMRIIQSGAQIVWVAIGSPRQERWMAENSAFLPGVTLIGVGAAFDFISANKPQAPHWVQRIGMEWFFRFLSEPGRLFKRYILGYPRFVFLIVMEALGFLKLPPADSA